MLSNRSWAKYPLDYRMREMQVLADWMSSGTSGAVIGIAGVGKSNLLGFLSHRIEALQQYLNNGSANFLPIAVDLNNLPANNVSTFYRAVLRAFHEARRIFDPDLQQVITQVYLEHRAASDPFLPQSGLRELLLQLQTEKKRVVLILDRFEWFCEGAEPAVTDTLRGLRDSFKDILSYIVGMDREVHYLSNPAALGELYELLDSYVCWVGPMNRNDARYLIGVETGQDEAAVDQATLTQFLRLTGGHPGLLKALCHWWPQAVDHDRPPEPSELIHVPVISHRLDRIWHSLTLVEQETLRYLVHGTLPVHSNTLEDPRVQTAAGLAEKGLLASGESGWRFLSELVAAYVTQKEGPAPGLIRLKDGLLFQGQQPLEDLSPLEENLLRFLVRYPRQRHTHSTLIEAVWPEEISKEGVSTEALYQTVRGLRRKIEPAPSQPQYVVNWRGTPEGGYQFFAEGRPGLRA